MASSSSVGGRESEFSRDCAQLWTNCIESMRSRIESVDRVVRAAARTVNCLDLRVMEDALLHVEPAARTPDEVVDGVVAVFAAEAG